MTELNVETVQSVVWFTFVSPTERRSCSWSSGWLPVGHSPDREREKRTASGLQVRNTSEQKHMWWLSTLHTSTMWPTQAEDDHTNGNHVCQTQNRHAQAERWTRRNSQYLTRKVPDTCTQPIYYVMLNSGKGNDRKPFFILTKMKQVRNITVMSYVWFSLTRRKRYQLMDIQKIPALVLLSQT